jgi:hypothetical protein
MTEQVISDINQTLGAIEKTNEQYASGYWVPSLGKDVRFKELSTAQQKKLIKSVVDSQVYHTEFIKTFYHILKESCVDDVSIGELTVIDKLMIALGLRISCIGSSIEIKVNVPDPENEEKTISQPVAINLMEVYENAKKVLTEIKPETIEDNSFQIVCNVPTIQTEFALESQLRPKNEDIDVNTTSELRNIIGEAFIDEIVKYVSSVSVKVEEEFVPVSWEEFSFKDRIRIVETFGSELLSKIVKYIGTIKKETEKIELVHFKIGEQTYDRRLAVDGSFFIIS